MFHRTGWLMLLGSALVANLFSTSLGGAQEGIVLTGAGAVNRSMGGAATAAPIDATGALYWNPASITGLKSSEMEFGMELLFPHTSLSSSVPAGALGPFGPPATVAGSDNGNSGVFPVPTFGLVYRDADSPLTYGLGVMAVGGLGVNYPASSTNPILMPPPPLGLGVGPLFTQLSVMQVVPTVAYQLSERLSVGVAPTVTLASLRVDPAIIGPAVPLGNTGFVSYPRGANSSIRAGGGFQAGAFYAVPEGWQFGASIKSPQWMEPFEFNSTDALGRPQNPTFKLDYPMIASAGVAYAGLPNWLFATDFRYVDYAHTDGFRQNGFGPSGEVLGLGWRSIFCLATGAQYQLTDAISLRLGYSYNQNPVPDSPGTSPIATINAAAPSVIEHTLYVGASWRVSDALVLSASYAHGFANSISGIYRGPVVIIPGSSVSSTASADTFIVGATVQFGGARTY